MKFTIKSSILADYINVAANLLKPNSTIISERYLKFVAADKLYIHAATRENYCTLAISDVEIQEKGDCCIDVTSLSEYVKKISSPYPVTLQTDDETLRIFFQKKKLKFGTISSQNFTTKPLASTVTDCLVLQKQDIVNICSFASKIKLDECRSPALTSVSLQAADDIICYFGDGTTMYKMRLAGTILKSTTINIPLSQVSEIKRFLSLAELEKDDAITLSIGENQIIIKTNDISFQFAKSSYDYPNASMLFNVSTLEHVEMDIDALSDDFQAAEAGFNQFDSVICSLVGNGDVFQITNSVKDVEFESEIDNPSYSDIELNAYTKHIAAGAYFMKGDKAKLYVKRKNFMVTAMLFEGQKRSFMTSIIVKEKVKVEKEGN